MAVTGFQRWRNAGRALALSALIVVVFCGSGRVVIPFNMDPAVLEVPTDASSLDSYDRAVRGIAAIMVKELRLPVPDRVTVFVYTSRGTFEQGLITDGNVSPARAAELGNFAIGIGKRRQLL